MANFRTGLLIGFLGAAVIALAVALVISLNDDEDPRESASPEAPLEAPPMDAERPPSGATEVEVVPPSNQARFDFRSPSGNIICRMDSEGALCGIGEFDYTFPPDPTCQLSGYGQFFSVGQSGKAELACADGLPAPPDSPILQYGQFARSADFECGSSQMGVYCENRRTGHGFAVSRERYSIR